MDLLRLKREKRQQNNVKCIKLLLFSKSSRQASPVGYSLHHDWFVVLHIKTRLAKDFQYLQISCDHLMEKEKLRTVPLNDRC